MFSALRKPFLTTVLCGALLMAYASSSSAESSSDLERRKNDVNGQIDGARKDFRESSKELADSAKALEAARANLASAQDELSLTSGQLAVARARDEQIQTRLDESQAALGRSIVEFEKATRSAALAEEQVREFTLQTLVDGNSGLRAFGDLLRGESPTSFLQQMTLNGSVSDAQVAIMQRLDAAEVVLKLKRDKVRELRDEVAVARRQSATNLVLNVTLEARAKEQQVRVGNLVTDRAEAKATATKTLSQDAAQLREFESERAKLSARLQALAAAELAKSRKKKPPAAPSHPHEGSPQGPPPSGGSATLFRPVKGPVTSPYGMRVHPVTRVYKLHDGTDLGAACGTPIKAAASGTVVERYYNGAYGNRLIVNHGIIRGTNVVTTYNHAAGYTVRVGQRVSRGQTIGYVGSTGYSTGCHLHFMVITNGRTVNPMSWLR
jgi:murein DD-endopeptidase MepM/ murein hydrolase activator NlpD